MLAKNNILASFVSGSQTSIHKHLYLHYLVQSLWIIICELYNVPIVVLLYRLGSYNKHFSTVR